METKLVYTMNNLTEELKAELEIASKEHNDTRANHYDSFKSGVMSNISKRIHSQGLVVKQDLITHYEKCLSQPIAIIGNVERQKHWKEFLQESIDYLNMVYPDSSNTQGYICIEEHEKQMKEFGELIIDDVVRKGNNRTAAFLLKQFKSTTSNNK